uniref:Transcription factor VSF-1 n=1 Tax=Solanum tuberosum TaxID=4113 RepID=M0ZWG0_SOLTU
MLLGNRPSSLCSPAASFRRWTSAVNASCRAAAESLSYEYPSLWVGVSDVHRVSAYLYVLNVKYKMRFGPCPWSIQAGMTRTV